nr:autotransporter domain-containing protein [Providencia alcalifaciens]
MEGLGSLRTDGINGSYAQAVSDDGKVVTGQASVDDKRSVAFIWTRESGMVGLGTLKGDNTGTSDPNGLSADGSTVVGDASTHSGNTHAFRWRKETGMTDLGILTSDNSGISSANGVSANGSVVVGSSDTDSGDGHAFRWTEKTGMVGLGTLRADNSGHSGADYVSRDGSVVVGDSDSDYDSNSTMAFRWTEKEGMKGLGTLKSDNSGHSEAYDLSSDGSVIVGESYTDSNQYMQAFRWTEATGMVNLGTLQSDNLGNATAYSVSDDGLVVAGTSITDSGESHAVLWKIKGTPTKPVDPTKPIDPTKPTIVTVDATNSSRAMSRTASRGFEVLDLYQNSLETLSSSRCQLGQDDYCVGLFTQYDTVSSNHRVATGLNGTLRLPAENWTVGVAMNFANNTTLTSNYDTRGSNHPAVGGYIRYQENRNNEGLYADLSASYLSQGLVITRDTLQNTEGGEGNATIKGYQARLSAGYGISVAPQTQLLPEVALTYKDINRSGYSEAKKAEFAAQYGRMGNKRTDIDLGIRVDHHFNDVVTLDGKVGSAFKLNSDRDAFTGYIPYIGAYAYDKGSEKSVTPYVTAGVNVNVTKNSTLRADAGWQKTDYNHDGVQAGLSYSYHW